MIDLIYLTLRAGAAVMTRFTANTTTRHVAKPRRANTNIPHPPVPDCAVKIPHIPHSNSSPASAMMDVPILSGNVSVRWRGDAGAPPVKHRRATGGAVGVRPPDTIHLPCF